MNDTERQRRYVVLQHEGLPEPHYDLLFENDRRTALVAARVFEWPIRANRRIERIADHRPMYLDYEGPIPADRGTVTRVAGGTCRVEAVGDGCLILHLDDGQVVQFPHA